MDRHRSRILAALVALAVWAPGHALPRRALVEAVDSIGMTVSDMERSVRFFTDVLTFEPVSDVEVTGEPYEQLEGVFGVKDPDGHPLEILQFPPGKGDPKWQWPSGRLFLGIDHTALVTGNTEASLGFYRDVLGLEVKGESENYGIEQEHLNGVFGARLRSTALRAAHGPGIDLLGYRAPRDGRPMPSDEHANDVAHWQTRLLSRDGDAATSLGKARAPLVSPGAVALPGRELGFSNGLMVRDPDGHVMEVVEAR